MLELQSPLGFDARFESVGVVLSEAPNFTLTQLAGDDKSIKKVLGKVPAKVGVVMEAPNRTLLRIGQHQFWLLGEPILAADGVYITPLSSSRTRIKLDGPNAREVLARCALIDFHPSEFKPGQFVMTAIHHTPAVIQCTDENEFYIFVLRTFALNAWEWLCGAGETAGV
jgi:methylglutamate dehydrogenase subunit D